MKWPRCNGRTGDILVKRSSDTWLVADSQSFSRCSASRSLVSIAGFALLYVLVGREPAVASNSVLVLRVGGDLTEVAPTDVVGYLRGQRTPTVRAIVDDLRKAKVDARISAVLLQPTGFDSPFWGKVQEIRDAVIDFRKSGKPVYAYLEYGGDREFYLATAADKIFLMPSSPLDLTGIATYELFLRGTLDKIGAYPDLHHIGQYKTAVNTFTEKGYTPAHNEMDEALNQDLYDQLVRGIADGRKKNEADVRALLDEGPFLPEDALRAGLVDDVKYEDQVEDALRASRPGMTDRRIDGDDYARVSTSVARAEQGTADRGDLRGRRDHERAERLRSAERRRPSAPTRSSSTSARRAATRSLRAIVLRIDSPGGSSIASDAIWRELMIARKERADRPIVASMSDLAASGGYYIALPAQVIVAQPSTLTGSIGIFGGKIVTGGVYEKIGAHIQSTSIGRNAEINSPARPYNPEELKKLQEQLQAFYDQFVEKVADSRHSTPEKIDQLAQGRVWTGQQAKDNGLVDVARRARSRDRRRQAAREDSGRQRSRAGRVSAAQELLRDSERSVRRGGRSDGGERVAVGEPDGGGDRRAADDPRPAGAVPPRRTARADAVHVLR